MPEVHIGPARGGDLDQLVALDARSFSRYDRYGRRDWAALLDVSLSGGPTRILVARSAETIIGAVVIAADLEASHANIVSLAVDVRFRRAGLATRLLCEALSQQPVQLGTVSLEVRADNAGARVLYEHLGFQLMRRMRKYYADGASALEYRARVPVVLDACR